LSSGAQVQLRALKRGLKGDVSPVFTSPAERAALTEAKLSLPEPARAADYRQETDRLLSCMDALTEADMAMSAWHQSGVHPLPWFLVQRLGETTMHRGDIHEGLDESFEYPDDVAEVLLPDYVARLPRMLDRDRAGELRAVISFGAAGGIRIAPGTADYVPSAEQPNVVLDAPAAALLRVATGRLHPQDGVASGRVRAFGDTVLLTRWRDLFRTL